MDTKFPDIGGKPAGEYIADCKDNKNVANIVDGKIVGPDDAPVFVGPPQLNPNASPERVRLCGVDMTLIYRDTEGRGATNCAVYKRD